MTQSFIRVGSSKTYNSPMSQQFLLKFENNDYSLAGGRISITQSYDKDISLCDYNMTLISCDDRQASTGSCKITNSEILNSTLLSENQDYHRSSGKNPEVNFAFWCPTLNPNPVQLSILQNRFRPNTTCSHNLLIESMLNSESGICQHFLEFERINKYAQIHMNEKRSFRTLPNQMSIYQVEIQGKNLYRYLKLIISANNCNCTVLITKQLLPKDSGDDVIPYLEGTHPESRKYDLSEAFVSRKKFEFLRSGIVSDFFDDVVKLEDEKNIISLKKIYIYIYS